MRLLALVIAVFMAGLVAGALTPGDKVQPYSSLTVDPPAPTGSSFAYTLGLLVNVTHVNASATYIPANTSASLSAGPSVGSVSLAYGLGLGLGAENYTAGSAAVADPAYVVNPPPATATVTETVTETHTKTITYTYTTIVTTVSGTTKVITTQVPIGPTEISDANARRGLIVLIAVGSMLLLIALMASLR